MIIKRKGLISMMLIKELMMVSCEGDFYASKELMDKFNLNSRQLKEIMESMGFEQARKYITDENGNKVRVRGYVCVTPSTVAEEETEEETAYDVEEEPTEKEFELLKPTIEEIKTLTNDLLINLLYEPDLNEYMYLKTAIHDNFHYLNNFANQF